MDLPIFSDNLKSSGSWTEQLAHGLAGWHEALAGGDAARAEALRRVDELRLAGANVEVAPGSLSAASEAVERWAAEPGLRLDRERLVELNGLLVEAAPGVDLLRTGAAPLVSPLHDPVPPVLLARMLDLACDWFSTEGFAELHPVEQATVVYLRLLDLHPFTRATAATALLAASLYTRRAGLPPLVIFQDPESQSRYAQALEAAFRMLTQPMVELFAAMLVRAGQEATR